MANFRKDYPREVIGYVAYLIDYRLRLEPNRLPREVRINYIREGDQDSTMSPGIGLMKRRLEKKGDAVALAVSGIAKTYGVTPNEIKTLETMYHEDAGDWYVALGWNEKRAVIKMDSVLGTITEIKEIDESS